MDLVQTVLLPKAELPFRGGLAFLIGGNSLDRSFLPYGIIQIITFLSNISALLFSLEGGS
jgi:hypothetical protein